MKIRSRYKAHPDSRNQSCVAAVQITCVLHVKVGHYLCIKRNMYCLVWCHNFFFFPSSLYLLKINTKMKNPTSCVMRLVIPLFNAKNIRLAEIRRQTIEVKGEGTMNKGYVGFSKEMELMCA